jgi:molybdopterin molybdotransferase
VVTGGSRADHVRALLRDAGAEFLVDGVDVRPGGPALLARLPDGRLVVGLPGNPLAALLSVLTLVQPLLAGQQGLGLPALRPAVLASAVDPTRSETVLRPYQAVLDPQTAVVTAEPSPWHGAAMLRGLADADGVLVCPGAGAPAGAVVSSLDLPW